MKLTAETMYNYQNSRKTTANYGAYCRD